MNVNSYGESVFKIHANAMSFRDIACGSSYKKPDLFLHCEKDLTIKVSGKNNNKANIISEIYHITSRTFTKENKSIIRTNPHSPSSIEPAAAERAHALKCGHTKYRKM